MLAVYLEAEGEEGSGNDDTTVSKIIIIIIIISAENKINCDICDQEAFIFQVEGNFCLSCWQNRTDPTIS